MKKLAKEFEPSIIEGRYFDLRYAATHVSVQPGGLASLVRQTLNRKLGKELIQEQKIILSDKNWWIRTSDWEIDYLSEKQVLYAADDCLAALQVLGKGFT